MFYDDDAERDEWGFCSECGVVLGDGEVDECESCRRELDDEAELCG